MQCFFMFAVLPQVQLAWCLNPWSHLGFSKGPDRIEDPWSFCSRKFWYSYQVLLGCRPSSPCPDLARIYPAKKKDRTWHSWRICLSLLYLFLNGHFLGFGGLFLRHTPRLGWKIQHLHHRQSRDHHHHHHHHSRWCHHPV